MDSNSYNSGDWFNRLIGPTRRTTSAWACRHGQRGPAKRCWPRRTARDEAGKPEIEAASGTFRDLLQIRKSSSLFRLRTADEVKARLTFPTRAATQVPTVLVATCADGYTGANFKDVLYFVNVDKVAHTLTIPAEAGKAYALHPVHATGTDRRRATAAVVDTATGHRRCRPHRTGLRRQQLIERRHSRRLASPAHSRVGLFFHPRRENPAATSTRRSPAAPRRPGCLGLLLAAGGAQGGRPRRVGPIWINNDKGYKGLQKVAEAYTRQTGTKVRVMPFNGSTGCFEDISGTEGAGR